MISEVYLMDCMEYLRTLPDNFADLALVDPPYGIGEANEKRMQSRHPSQKKYKGGTWDNFSPDQVFFNEIIRVSKNQIIFGANHFISKMPYDSSCWIFWDKDGYGDFADGELAWASYKTAVRRFKFTWNGFRKQVFENRIHATQKPVALYDWLYKSYLPSGGKVYDPMLGSGSNRIAADKAGNIDFYATEIDADYFNAQEKRWREYKAQAVLTFPERIEPEQTALF